MNSGSERAPRRERVKRMAWALGSLAVSVVVITAAVVALAKLGVDPTTTVVAVAIIAVDFHIFGWGVDRFDITPPKEFREVEADEQ